MPEIDETQQTSKVESNKVDSQKNPTTMADFLRAFNGKHPTLVVDECIAHEVRLVHKSNSLSIKLKQIHEDDQEHFVEKKVKAYDTSYNIWTGAISAVASIATGFRPDLQGQLAGITHAATAIKEQYKQQDDATMTGLQHMIDKTRTFVSDKAEHLRQHQQEFDRIVGALDKLSSGEFQIRQTFSGG